MIINRSHIPWAIFVVLATALSAVIFAANFHPDILPFHVNLPKVFGPIPPLRNTVGGTPMGLMFGTASLLIFIFAALLGGRKKQRTWPMGNVQWWLKGHIWLTTLTIPFVAFHCDFKSGGPMTTTLIVLYAIVMASGFYGVALQQFMPHWMTQRLSREVVYEQIPFIRERLVQKAEALWNDLKPSPKRAATMAHAGHGEPDPAGVIVGEDEDTGTQVLCEFLHDECLPFLRARRADTHRLASQRGAEDTFRLLKMAVNDRWHDKIDTIYQWCDDRRQLDVQAKMQHWLHSWLIVHVPLSFVLLVFTFWHAYITIIYL